MTPHEATRTLVKSPPEVWAQCSEAEALERHLNGSFGEIRITRLEPETAVAWEGEQVRGTVRIEPSAWGTRVTLTAQVEEAHAPAPAPPAEIPAAAAEVPPAAAEVPPPTVEELPPPPVAEEPAKVQPPPVVDPPGATAVEAHPEPAQPTPVVRGESLWARLARRFRAAPPPAEPTASPPISAHEPPPAPADDLTVEGELPPIPDDPPPAPIAEAPQPPPAIEPPPEPAPAPPDSPAPGRPDPIEILHAALDSLGQAHHRPYSRA